ncbi:MAG: chromate transporter [Faecousia sp.]
MPLRERVKTALRLFFIFLKIGAFTFGGGYAMIPLIEYETAEKRRLIEKDEISDIVAIAESTPGPIAVNSATFIGYRTAGLLGAFAATVGVVLPSFIIILLIAFFLRRVMDYRIVRYAFFGIRAGVLALIVKAVVSFWRRAEHNGFSWCVMIAAFLWAAILDWSVIALIALCGLAGFVYCLVQRRRGAMQ